MDPSNRRTSSVTLLLVGLVVLIGLGAITSALLPIVDCPKNHLDEQLKQSRGTQGYLPCTRCGGEGKVTFLNRWLKGREPLPE